LQRRLEHGINGTAANISEEIYVCEKRPMEENYKRNIYVQIESCRRDLKGDTQHCSRYVKRDRCVRKETYGREVHRIHMHANRELQKKLE